MSTRIPIRIGTAGWSIPQAFAERLPGEGSHLARYAAGFGAVEINSSFHRPHRRSTYERWAASTGPDFRFAVKLPKTITHERRLEGCTDLLARFADEVGGLGAKGGPLLVQLPPSLAFDARVAGAFFTELATTCPGPIVCEPRHASWFGEDADGLLRGVEVARVAADPARVPVAGEPAGWPAVAYFRLHGSPQIYRSAYGATFAAAHAARLAVLAAASVETWTIFDNTASGAATGDALALREASAA